MSSSMRREDRRGRDDADAYWDGMFRRMVSLPRNILGGFSRAMDHGINVLNINSGDRIRQQMFPPPHYRPSVPSPPFYPPSLAFPPPQTQHNPMVHDEWAFLTAFEQQYGTTHPFFYACRFSDALKIAKDENKFLFLYLHSPDYPFTPPFCKETLCSELVVAFLDANFVSWGGIYYRGEGLQLGSSLRPGSFPFCAVIAPASGDNIAVLQQIEGPVSPSELVETLQKTMEEQGMAFGGSRAKEEEKRSMDRRLREEQDAAYVAALKIDQEKEAMKKLPLEEVKVQKTPTTLTPPPAGKVHNEKKPSMIKPSKIKDATIIPRGTNHRKQDAGKGKDTTQLTQILIRFPNGERRERSFSPSDKIQAIYNYIDSLGLAAEIGNYRLLSSFPKKVYGVDQMGMTLKDAGLHPRATLFLQLP